MSSRPSSDVAPLRVLSLAGALVACCLVAGCADTPQPDEVGPEAGRSAAPTGTPVTPGASTGSSPATPTEGSATGASTPTPTPPAPGGSGGSGGSTAMPSLPSTTKLPPGWPGAPLPPGRFTESLRQPGTPPTWLVTVDTAGTPAAVSTALVGEYTGAGYTVSAPQALPNGGISWVAQRTGYVVSVAVMVAGSNSSTIVTVRAT